MDSMRLVGDTVADEVISDLFTSNSVDAVNTLMRSLVVNEYPESESLPTVVRDYLKSLDRLPDWADVEKIGAGEQVFWKYGPRLILILHCYALPFCYLGKNGVQVLALTNRLNSNSTRRILETAQFLVDVMQPGGLTAGEGRGRRTVQKVRLMHAAVRHLITRYPLWKREFGLPVNQEDMTGTLIAFSWISLDGLKKIGVELTQEELDAYLHCWQVVGHQLGIRDDMIPADIASAEAVSVAIARRQFAACPEGQQLTRSLVQSVQYQLPGNLFDLVPELLIRYFLGTEHAAMLGVNEEGVGFNALRKLITLPLTAGGVALSDLLKNSAALSEIAEKVGKILINSIVLVERGGNRPSFTIPQELRQTWGVDWVS